jgi:hypothetical protein
MKVTVTQGPSSKGKTFDLDQDVLFLGRSPKCDIQISDPKVSGIHLKIFKIINALFVEDLKSSNGTSVNGELLKPGEGRQVGPEDIIILAKDTRIGLEEIPAGKNSEIQNAISSLDTSLRRSKQHLAGERRSRSLGQFDLVSSVSRFLTDTLELDEFIGKMLKALLDALPRVDRTAVFLYKTEKEDVEFFAGRNKSDGDYRAVDYGRRFVRRVLKEGNPVFLADTSDKELRNFSIIKQTEKIKSVACFPITAGSDMYGVLYLDGIRKPCAFREEDLSMLQTLANHTAAALINHQLAAGIFSTDVPGQRFRRSASTRVGQETNHALTKPDLSYRRKPAFVTFLPDYFFWFLVSFLLVHFSPPLSRLINDQIFSLLKTTPHRILLQIGYGMVLAVPFVLFGIRKLMWNAMSRYEVDTDGVRVLTGTLARKEYYLSLQQFDDVSFKQNIIEVPFKVGTLILKSGAWGEVGLRGIHDVKNLVDLIRLKKKEPPERYKYRY